MPRILDEFLLHIAGNIVGKQQRFQDLLKERGAERLAAGASPSKMDKAAKFRASGVGRTQKQK